MTIDAAILKKIEEQIPVFLNDKRWFASKGRPIKRAVIVDHFPLNDKGLDFLVRIEYIDGGAETYQLPFIDNFPASGGIDEEETKESVNLLDATFDTSFVRRLLELANFPERIPVGKGELVSDSANLLDVVIPPQVEMKRITAEQSNTSIIFGDRIVKLYRKLVSGSNVDYMLPLILWRDTAFRSTPAPVGKIEYIGSNSYLIATVMQYIPDSVDAWSRFTWQLGEAMIETDDSKMYEDLADDAHKLGEIIGEMHTALSSLGPPGSLFDVKVKESYIAELKGLVETANRSLSARQNTIDTEAVDQMHLLLDNKTGIFHEILSKIDILDGEPVMITHGDLHLGQVLYSSGKYFVIDFEGEPMRSNLSGYSLSLRYKDVAGMLRSFDYAFAFAERKHAKLRNREKRLRWVQKLTDSFLIGYRGKFGHVGSDKQFSERLEIFMIEKAIYELNYELNNRPDWISIPLSYLINRTLEP